MKFKVGDILKLSKIGISDWEKFFHKHYQKHANGNFLQDRRFLVTEYVEHTEDNYLVIKITHKSENDLIVRLGQNTLLFNKENNNYELASPAKLKSHNHPLTAIFK